MFLALRILHPPHPRVKNVPRGTFDGTLAAQLQKERGWMFHAGDDHLWPGRLCHARTQLDNILPSRGSAPVGIQCGTPRRSLRSRLPSGDPCPPDRQISPCLPSWSGLVRVELLGTEAETRETVQARRPSNSRSWVVRTMGPPSLVGRMPGRLNHRLLRPLVASRFHFQTDSQRAAAAAL